MWNSTFGHLVSIHDMGWTSWYLCDKFQSKRVPFAKYYNEPIISWKAVNNFASGWSVPSRLEFVSIGVETILASVRLYFCNNFSM